MEGVNTNEKYKILKDLVSFNTIKDKENSSILNYVEEYLKSLGFKNVSKTKNLVMQIGENPVLGFLGHTDTVEYIDGWESMPHEMVIKDEKIYGLGVWDMKGGIAAMLDSLSEFDLNKIKSGMKLYLTYDEEIGFGGTYELVDGKEIFPPNMIFGEPTNNKYLTGCKGLLECEVYFNGKKAHSSNPDKGISANINAVKFLNELNEFYENEIKVIKKEEFEVPYTTMNVGLINGGSAKNSIPANCYVAIDFRIADKKHIKLIKEKINELLNKYMGSLKIIEEINPFMSKVDYLEKQETASFMTEASLIECTNKIILGVGPVTAHEVNEYIEISSYEKLVKQYKDLIEKLCM